MLEELLKVKKDDKDLSDPKQSIISSSKGKTSRILPFVMEYFEDYVLSNGNFYKHNGKFYELQTKENVAKKICNFFIDNGIFDYWNETKEKELLKMLVYTDAIPEKELDCDDDYLNMNNGVLNARTHEFEPHDKKFGFTYCLDANYNKDAKNCPHFLTFLSGLFAVSGDWEKGYKTDKAMVENIIMLCGYILYPVIKINGMFFFIGSGSNGKSILVKIIQMFFPKKFTSVLSLSAISKEDSNNRVDLINSKLNISAEEKDGAINVEELKKITYGEEILISRKYLDPIKIKAKTKILCCTNNMPYFNDTSHGTKRRLLFFDFPNKFVSEKKYKLESFPDQRRIFVGRDEDEMLDEIKEEKEAILNLFIEGLKMLKKNKWQFHETPAMEKIKEEYDANSDVFGVWLKENYEVSNSEFDFIATSIVYNDFMDFYNSTNGKKSIHSINYVGKRIKELFRIDAVKTSVRDGCDVKTVRGFNIKKKEHQEIKNLMA